ncbi:cell division protein FtsZ [Helicobacter cetorum]|uniref:Cell division protein FtsZ n=1 Tax=Helicobacter cetorum (strain ATCC BAA-429 / MIT 00-7128) TaxID=182217 RepID=I0ENY3_HELC0|nr:cell division protein FtsZ [Helicobacter cetorum]AFI04652.1 cell division protein FtsZ [Helicobacter cetorum MIT 00-7128]
MIHEVGVEEKNIGQAEIQEINDSHHKGAKIVVFGVGGGGSNMIKHLIETNMHQSVIPIATNTDEQHLKNNPASIKIRLGKETTGGLGAGTNSEVGKAAAEESAEEIRELVKGANLVIVSTGLGGGTGTGAAPVIARIAKEAEALTVAVVTKPFKHEGSKRKKRAEEGLEELKKVSDSIVVIPNENLRSTMKRTAGFNECLREVDEVLVRAVSGISGVITQEGNINVDFADLKTIFGFKGFALMGIGEATGENSAATAVENAIQSPLLDDVSIDGAMGVIACFEHHENYPASMLWEAIDIISERVHPDAETKFGDLTRNDIPVDQVRVTIIATGSENSKDEVDIGEIATASQTILKQLRKVGNGEYIHIPTEEELEKPTCIRIQQD